MIKFDIAVGETHISEDKIRIFAISCKVSELKDKIREAWKEANEIKLTNKD